MPDDELIFWLSEINSRHSQLQNVRKFIPICFPNISDVEIITNDSGHHPISEIRSIITQDGQSLKLNQTISLNVQPEVWLNNLSDGIKETIKLNFESNPCTSFIELQHLIFETRIPIFSQNVGLMVYSYLEEKVLLISISI